ncbi:hypothetical protein [Cupriavidus pauculus]|uniref:hypothetical protein n=1 Tax=Cupriavidus pauculus TaxID=82633 RepID=UPI0011AF9F3D|nr:hypothetical protein [Cupriavidus pauculus]
MPFAYAGTRRRRNRDRRRPNESPENSANPQNREGAPEAREERDPLATRRASSEENPTAREGQRATTRQDDSSAGIGSQDLQDPDSRDPDAPPVDNRS